MTDVPAAGATFEVECPHCHKSFQAEVIAGRAARHHGFKCPHCRLFVPYERAGERNLLEQTKDRLSGPSQQPFSKPA